MAKSPPPSIKNPTLEYFAYRGPNRVARKPVPAEVKEQPDLVALVRLTPEA